MSNHKPQTLLVFCPYWEPSMPYLSLASLSAYLREQGYSADQWDLNLSFYEKAFDYQYLRERLSARRPLLSQQSQKELELILESLTDLDELKTVFKTEAFYDYQRLKGAQKALERVYRCFNLLYPGAKLSSDHFEMPQRHASSREVIAATQDTFNNPFLDFYQAVALPRLKENPPDLVGFSIARDNQIIPTFTLAKMIRETFPDTHITVGGAYFTKIADGLKQDNHPAFQELIHSAVKGEGEVPLLKLVQALENQSSLEEVPGLIYNDAQGKLQVNGFGQALSMNDIPTPDFEGLDLDNYWSADLVLPILGSRDCYWKDCTFCDHYMQFAGFRSRKPEKIAQDLKTLQERYGASHFQFCDETMSPNFGRRLATSLKDNATNVHWYTMARLQKGFDPETAQLWRESGCLFILMGLESANAELANKMVKGTDNALTETVLTNLHRAGIFTFAFLFFGFPGETLETAAETLNFIRKNQEIINSLGSGEFILKKTSPLFRNYKAFGITPNPKDLEDDWGSRIRFEIENAMNTEQAVLFHQRFREEMGLRYKAALWQQIPRIAFFLYLSRFGKDKVAAHDGLSPQEKALEQIRQLKTSGHGLAAEHLNQQLLKQDPFFSAAANQAAYFALQKGDIARAQEWSDRAQKYGAHRADSHFVAGLIALRKNAFAVAKRYFEQTLYAAPYFAEAFLLLAEYYATQGDDSRMRHHAQEALKIHLVDTAFERFGFYSSTNFKGRCERLLSMSKA